MSRKILTTDAKHHGDEYPPSRPTQMTFLIAAAIIISGALIVNWQAVSTITHFPQIKSSLGL